MMRSNSAGRSGFRRTAAVGVPSRMALKITTCAGLTVACDEHGRPGKTPSQRTRAKRIRVGCPLEMRLFCATKIRDGTEKGPERSGSFLLCVEICPSFPAAHPECPWVADRLHWA